MATESIGSLIPTAIPGYADAADIQAALRAYHYGSYSYNPANTSPGNLITPSIAKTIYDLQQGIDTLSLDDLTDVTITSATTNQVLSYDGSVWVNATFSALPTQTGQSGKYLTTDGTTASWAAISQVPSQTGQSGKYLTTDGSTASWSTVDALPSQTGNSGKYLTTNGTTASWTVISTSTDSNPGIFMLMGG